MHLSKLDTKKKKITEQLIDAMKLNLSMHLDLNGFFEYEYFFYYEKFPKKF